MNDRDSEHVVAQFLAHGYRLTDNKKDADVILLNTCSVRQHAEDKVFSELGRLRKLKITNPKSQIPNKSQITNSKRKTHNAERTTPIIGVIGCMAENLKDTIIERMPHVDLVCGPNDLGRVYQLVEKFKTTQKNIVSVGAACRSPSFYKHLYQPDKKHSYVVIMEGCNNFCSYCVVPYVRGSERSRPFKDVLAEVSQLVAKGISSVTLLGQNVNSYDGGCNFPKLLRKVSAIAGVDEISFATSHPKDASLELFEAMRDCNNIRKHLHLPIQSGSDRILRLMNRGYTREHYLSLVDSYRAVVGEGAMLGTDVIVGFPTETEKDFQDTVSVLKKVKFHFAYLFKYSARLRTKAAALADDVPQATKEKRHRILLDLQKQISKKYTGR